MPRPTRGGCMPAAMTGIPQCCWARRGIWRRRAIFRGRVALIFQPAEEAIGGGAGVSWSRKVSWTGSTFRSGLWHCTTRREIWRGTGFTPRRGRSWLRWIRFDIHITRQVGGHGAMPHETRDPVMAACGIAQAVQTIVSRNHYALDDLVVSVTQIHTGTVEQCDPRYRLYQWYCPDLRSGGAEDGDGPGCAQIVDGQAASLRGRRRKA